MKDHNGNSKVQVLFCGYIFHACFFLRSFIGPIIFSVGKNWQIKMVGTTSVVLLFVELKFSVSCIGFLLCAICDKGGCLQSSEREGWCHGKKC